MNLKIKIPFTLHVINIIKAFMQENTKGIPYEISILKYVFIFLAPWRTESIHIK